MTENALYTRFAERRLTEALEDSPVTLIHGPRQCGKTTLALMVCAPEHLASGGRPSSVRPTGSPGYAYLTFDDAVTKESAETDPMGFVSELPERVILDEVQRVPGLFAALKLTVDRWRVPGRFLLTGSSNVLLTPALSDSLAGRMETVPLHPLASANSRPHRGRPASSTPCSEAASGYVGRRGWDAVSASGSHRGDIRRP